MHLLEGLRKTALAQEKVSKAPCCLCRNRIEVARLSERLLRLHDVACCFIGAGEIHPVKRRAGIYGGGTLIIRDRQRQIGVCEIELPITAQTVPKIRIRRLGFSSSKPHLRIYRGGPMGGDFVTHCRKRQCPCCKSYSSEYEPSPSRIDSRSGHRFRRRDGMYHRCIPQRNSRRLILCAGFVIAGLHSASRPLPNYRTSISPAPRSPSSKAIRSRSHRSGSTSYSCSK